MGDLLKYKHFSTKLAQIKFKKIVDKKKRLIIYGTQAIHLHQHRQHNLYFIYA